MTVFFVVLVIAALFYWRFQCGVREYARKLQRTQDAIALIQFPTVSEIMIKTGIASSWYQGRLLEQLESKGIAERITMGAERESRWRLVNPAEK